MRHAARACFKPQRDIQSGQSMCHPLHYHPPSTTHSLSLSPIPLAVPRSRAPEIYYKLLSAIRAAYRVEGRRGMPRCPVAISVHGSWPVGRDVADVDGGLRTIADVRMPLADSAPLSRSAPSCAADVAL